jgi:hypothetical protein
MLLRPATRNCSRNIGLLFRIAAAKFQDAKFRALPHSCSGNGSLLRVQLRGVPLLFITLTIAVELQRARGQYYYSMNGRYSGTLINFLSTDTIVGAVGGPWEQRNANFMANVLDQQPTPLLQAKHPSSNGLKRWKRNLCCKMPVTNYYENLKWRTAACWLF